MKKKKLFMTTIKVGLGLAVLFKLLDISAKVFGEAGDIDEDNPYLSGFDEPEEMAEAQKRKNWYERWVKPKADRMLAFWAMLALAPVYGIISLAIFLDDPGPVLFTQKRVGINKRFFHLHKFRTMKMDTPHDVPTHLLKNPERYITKVGAFLRKTSLDELPQIWDIFRGKMSIIGPRPALWNQYDLVAERERYDANSVPVALSGLAQTQGRDELEIPLKAKLDGEYVKILRGDGLSAMLFDAGCVVETIFSAFRGTGVVEGGTGAMKKKRKDV